MKALFTESETIFTMDFKLDSVNQVHSDVCLLVVVHFLLSFFELGAVYLSMQVYCQAVTVYFPVTVYLVSSATIKLRCAMISFKN